MSRNQYSLSGIFDWQSNSGAALTAIVNNAGSGKKITIRSLELQNLTMLPGQDSMLTLVRTTSDVSGTVVNLTPSDSTAVWPSTVQVFSEGYVNGSSGVPVRKVHGAKQASGAGTLAWFSRQTGADARALFRGQKSLTPVVEKFVINQDEAFALCQDNVSGRSQPVCVMVTVVVSGTPNRSWSGSWFSQIQGKNSHVFAIKNSAGSGEVVTVTSVAYYEAGTLDSPYFQAVPIGGLVLDNPLDAQLVTPTAMDSQAPSISSYVACYKNVTFYPFGLPENAFSEASTGTPKGMNYLKCKDFNGPAWRATFPEQAAHQVTLNDTLGFGMNSHRGADIGFRRAGIVLRENEGLALVSAAETAILATAVGVSGSSTWHVNILFDVEPAFEPTLTISGLKNPSEIRIFQAGTTTEVAGQENITTGEFQWVFDPTVTPSVDIAILSLGYQNVRFTDFALTLANTTIPVQQQIDRQYGNN